MRHALFLAMFLAAAAALGGCRQGPVAGEVVAREYTPGYYSYDYDPDFAFYGAYGRGWRHGYGYGVGFGWGYRTAEYTPASYDLRLRQWKYDPKAARWKSSYKDLSVAQPVFAQSRPGDWFTYEPAPATHAATQAFSRSLSPYPIGATKPIPPSLAQEILAARYPREEKAAKAANPSAP